MLLSVPPTNETSPVFPKHECPHDKSPFRAAARSPSVSCQPFIAPRPEQSGFSISGIRIHAGTLVVPLSLMIFCGYRGHFQPFAAFIEARAVRSQKRHRAPLNLTSQPLHRLPRLRPRLCPWWIIFFDLRSQSSAARRLSCSLFQPVEPYPVEAAQ